ncbi:hypothetical protein [Bradyrhizobium sp. Leo121]|uniref:hypothetical protein n=1 Tax=Bradyrhizobium sp. Leo121 TaxID=1571195 RepID=UPI00102A00CD|nr:hypothetical protein [Bradyrhizobium sp. Leo121]RZN16539.1 hypothetical protein CWO90_39440 [Bradyrhizobium sp. Leo121]
MRTWLVIAIAALVLGVLSGVPAYETSTPRETWQEIAWPFPRDGWPAGRAFRCNAVACGGDIEVYIRPKLGFCNCTTGVADDDEVDRVADVDLISTQFVPLQAGKAVRVADMPGRMRTYDLKIGDGVPHGAIGIAVSHRCDLLVAAAQGRGDAAVVQRAALQLLASAETARWLKFAMNTQ